MVNDKDVAVDISDAAFAAQRRMVRGLRIKTLRGIAQDPDVTDEARAACEVLIAFVKRSAKRGA